MNKRIGFTLSEVLIVIGIIGIIAEITIPSVIENFQEAQWVAGVLKFNDTLQQAVSLWKQDVGCLSDAYTCIVQQGFPSSNISNFSGIAKFMKATPLSSGDLPNQHTLNYYGDIPSGNAYGEVSNIGGGGQGGYILQDGTTFTMEAATIGFSITVDVNGKKPPNRVGKDVHSFSVGFYKPKDIYYYPRRSNYYYCNSLGLCGEPFTQCDPNNVMPPSASPTAYVIINHKIPDFNAISQSVSNFKP